MRPNRGFALAGVLWVVLWMSAATATVLSTARSAVVLSNHQRAATQARYAAEGCAEGILAGLALEGRAPVAPRPWSAVFVDLPCVGRVVPDGLRMSFLWQDDRWIDRLEHRETPFLRSQINDWGARYREWRAGQQPDAPPLSSFPVARSDSVFRDRMTFDSARVSLQWAPVEVLLLLPGVTPAAAEALIRARSADSALSLSGWADALAGSDRRTLAQEIDHLERVTTYAPVRWRIEGRSEVDGLVVRVEHMVEFREGLPSVVWSSAWVE